MKIKIVLIALLIGIISGCKKDSSSSSATCSDGIQNQDETGVDCGGSCPACPSQSVICNGNGSNTYWPLAAGNYWYYDGPATNDFNLTVAANPVTYNSISYFMVENILGGVYYMRTASNGDLMRYNTSTGTECVYIPASPTNNQTWAYPMDFSATRKVINTNASVTTGSCTYTGCLQIQHLSSTGTPGVTYYYKKGIGIVRTDEIWAGAIVSDLANITLH